MKIVSHLPYLVAIGVILSAAAMHGFAVDPPSREKPSPHAGYYAARSKLASRVNGLLLSVKTVVQPEPSLKSISLDWQLEYNGKRPPCVVLTPTMEHATFGQTEITVYAEGKGRLREARLVSPFAAGKYFAKASWFLTIPEGQPVSGKMVLDLSEAKDHFLKHWPAEFDKQQAPPLMIQVRHQPHDRGIAHSLDAWTGELYSRVLRVPLQNW